MAEVGIRKEEVILDFYTYKLYFITFPRQVFVNFFHDEIREKIWQIKNEHSTNRVLILLVLFDNLLAVYDIDASRQLVK
jgi:hypothetical protein